MSYMPRNTWQEGFAIWLIATVLMVACMWLAGCGSQTERQTKTEERLVSTTGPIVVDTPIGQFTAQPIRHEMTRSEREVSSERTRYEGPDIGAAVAPLLGASPLGPVIGILGLITAAATGWKAVQATRQRDQVIKSVEHARDALPDDVDEKFTAKLAEKQDDATQKIVQKITS